MKYCIDDVFILGILFMIGAEMNVKDWINSPSYLYETSLFAYAFINFVLLFIFGSVLYFLESEPYFLPKVILSLGVCVALCFPDVWYRILFRKKKYLFKDQKIIQEYLDNLDDEQEKEYICILLKENGMLPMSRKQQVALGFLFMVLVFDLFFIMAWVNGYGIMVWQPDWVLSCIDWIKRNLTLPPIYQDTKFFYLIFDSGTKGDAFRQEFGNEFLFLQQPVSNTFLFYHFVRVLSFIPTIFALCVVLWKPFQGMGNDDKDPNNIMSIRDFLQVLAWSLVMAFFGIFPAMAIIEDVTFFMDYIRRIKDVGVVFIMYFFVAMSVRFFAGWFMFFWRIFSKFLGAM